MKLHSPPSERNKDPILDVLRRVAPHSGFALELSAGAGVHSAHFAAAFPDLQWQATDRDAAALASIAAWRQETGLPNLLPPLPLDVHDERWPTPAAGADLILSINMIHITPWETSEALFRGVAAHLAPGGVLLTYGPYLVDGAFTSPSNARFEEWLKSLDPRNGQRDLATLAQLAARNGLAQAEVLPMPSNNFCVVYRAA